MEYVWFNNVETKPGIGYPKDWENQDRWKGGWVRGKNGKIVPRQGAKWRILSKIFANPHLPEIDDFYEPYTFEYEWLQAAPELQAQPTARPRSLLTGELLNKIEWSGNWEDMLGGEFEKRSHDYNFEGIEKEIFGHFEKTFMMYLPRLCEHCLNRSEEHTSELQSLMRNSYAVFCLKTNKSSPDTTEYPIYHIIME